MKCVKLISAVIALGFATTAMADTISYTTDITNVMSLDPSLQQFNPTLGTLTSASVALDVAITPIVSVFNISSSPVEFASATISSADGNTFVITDPYSSNTVSTDYSYTVTDQTANAGPGTTDFTDPTTVSLSTLTSAVPGADLVNYIGSGSYALGYSSTGTAYYTGTPGTPLFYGGDITMGGTATVTYTYSPLSSPAPAPVPAALGGGLVLMGLMATSTRFRRKPC
ncbi:MAG TPA: choice-of-anchor E domain-containing protein [Tepidisphaeraceae bacterium]|nr:choice-of-anchor E domain-containing protein [Tepidisphaeraceae bacterium]